MPTRHWEIAVVRSLFELSRKVVNRNSTMHQKLCALATTTVSIDIGDEKNQKPFSRALSLQLGAALKSDLRKDHVLGAFSIVSCDRHLNFPGLARACRISPDWCGPVEIPSIGAGQLDFPRLVRGVPNYGYPSEHCT